jgi:hypothetical protein
MKAGQILLLVPLFWFIQAVWAAGQAKVPEAMIYGASIPDLKEALTKTLIQQNISPPDRGGFKERALYQALYRQVLTNPSASRTLKHEFSISYRDGFSDGPFNSERRTVFAA